MVDKPRRKQVELTDTVGEVITKMAEGNPGAVTVMAQMDPLQILLLDDMNIRGPQIWVAYKDHCGEDMETFLEAVKNRDQEMIATVNEVTARGACGEPHWKAVPHGASKDARRPTLS